DHDEIHIEAEPPGVLRTDVANPAHHGVGDDLLGAREGATHRARDPFEVAGADRHLPARVDSQVVEDGDEAVQHLGGHAPVARAAHVDEAAALEALTRTEEEIHGTRGRHLAVVGGPGERREGGRGAAGRPGRAPPAAWPPRAENAGDGLKCPPPAHRASAPARATGRDRWRPGVRPGAGRPWRGPSSARSRSDTPW